LQTENRMEKAKGDIHKAIADAKDAAKRATDND
jgi:uncharacterized protein YjbJ (UPF0337 family)